MIRKATITVLFAASLGTVIVGVLSYTACEQLECISTDELQYDICLVKDAAFAKWRGAAIAGHTPPLIPGLILWQKDDGNGARHYVQSYEGSLSYTSFRACTPGTTGNSTRHSFAGFEYEQDWPRGFTLDCGMVWNSMGEQERKQLTESWSAVTAVTVPLWVPFLLLSAYPSWKLALAPLRRHYRRKRNECLHCGYNLTGNISGACPECGKSM